MTEQKRGAAPMSREEIGRIRDVAATVPDGPWDVKSYGESGWLRVFDVEGMNAPNDALDWLAAFFGAASPQRVRDLATTALALMDERDQLKVALSDEQRAHRATLALATAGQKRARTAEARIAELRERLALTSSVLAGHRVDEPWCDCQVVIDANRALLSERDDFGKGK